MLKGALETSIEAMTVSVTPTGLKSTASRAFGFFLIGRALACESCGSDNARARHDGGEKEDAAKSAIAFEVKHLR